LSNRDATHGISAITHASTMLCRMSLRGSRR